MFRKFLSFFVLLSLTSNHTLYAVGAGVAPLLAIGGDAYMAVGKERRTPRRGPAFEAWSDFGGSSAGIETPDQTALREFREETANSFPAVTLADIQGSQCNVHNTGNNQYHLYFVDMRGGKDVLNGRSATVQDIQNQAAVARLVPGNQVEKTDYAFIKVTDLLYSLATNNSHIPGIAGNANLYGFFKDTLRTPAVQQILRNFVQSVTGQAPAIPQDVVITYSADPTKRQAIYDTFVRNTIPGIARPDPYHVTLGWAQRVKPQHVPLLQAHLQAVANQHLGSTTFTVSSVKKYLVNRQPSFCPLVLSPTAQEATQFKAINQHILNALQQFNLQHGENYASNPDCVLGTYEPHMTLVNTTHLQRTNLNRDHLLATLTPKIQPGTLEVLHRAPLIRPAPLPTSPAPHTVTIAAPLSAQAGSTPPRVVSRVTPRVLVSASNRTLVARTASPAPLSALVSQGIPAVRRTPVIQPLALQQRAATLRPQPTRPSVSRPAPVAQRVVTPIAQPQPANAASPAPTRISTPLRPQLVVRRPSLLSPRATPQLMRARNSLSSAKPQLSRRAIVKRAPLQLVRNRSLQRVVSIKRQPVRVLSRQISVNPRLRALNLLQRRARP